MNTFYTKLIYFTAAVLMLIWPAMVNGFPFIYNDLSTYLASGFELKTPFDRPITYGIFLRIASLNGFSLWGVIVVQAILVSWLIFKMLVVFLKDAITLQHCLVCMLILCAFTPLPWICSLLMPDIFTPLLVLSLVLILYNGNSTNSIGLYVVFFFSCTMHLSHFMFAFLVLVLYLIVKKRLFAPRRLGTIKITVLFLLVGISVIPGASALSKSKHVFFLGAMVEHGIVKTYLDDNCSNHSLALCQYKDSLPTRAYEFIWDKTSPFYKIGGWKQTKKEFNEIIFATLTQPRYIWLHIKASVLATLDQLRLFYVGDGLGRFDETTELYERLEKFIPNDIAMHKKSLQYSQNRSLFSIPNYFIFASTLISFCLLIFLLVFKSQQLSMAEKNTMWFILAILVLSAWNNGTFANALDRLGAKMVWLIPFLAFIVVSKIILAKRELQK